MKHLTRCLLALVCMAMMAACDVHQWPELKDEPKPVPPDKPEVPADPTEPRTVTLRMVFQPDFFMWEHYYDPILGEIEELYPDSDFDGSHPGSSDRYTNVADKGVMMIEVKVYENGNLSRCLSEYSFTRMIDGQGYDTTVDIDLEQDVDYYIASWAHLKESANHSPFYSAADFNSVSIIADNYKATTDYRDGFFGKTTAPPSKASAETYIINMNRPMGKFELVTTDLSEFLDRETSRRGLPSRAKAEDYTVRISYPYYYPCSFNIMTNSLENSKPGYYFTTKMTVTGESEASLGFDYVMLNDIMDSAVQAQVDVYDDSGEHVAGSSVLRVPMRRDYHTLLRGAFLSMEGNGGVGIDPDYDGDHNVTIH